MPSKFANLGKGAKDLLNKKYQFDTKFKITTSSANGVELTTDGKLAKSTLGSLAAKFSPFSGVNIEKLGLDTNNRLFVEAKLTDIVDGATFSAKVEDGNKQVGVLGVSAGVAGTQVDVDVDAVNTAVNASAVIGYGDFEFGGSANVDLAGEGGPAATAYGAALSYSAGDLNVTVKSTGKFSNAAISALSSLNSDTTIAATFDGAKKSLIVGGAYKVDSDTTLQGKLDTGAQFSFNWIQKLSKSVSLTASGAINLNDVAGDSHKMGLAFTLA